jgi:hypothetical protein
VVVVLLFIDCIEDASEYDDAAITFDVCAEGDSSVDNEYVHIVAAAAIANARTVQFLFLPLLRIFCSPSRVEPYHLTRFSQVWDSELGFADLDIKNKI